MCRRIHIFLLFCCLLLTIVKPDTTDYAYTDGWSTENATHVNNPTTAITSTMAVTSNNQMNNSITTATTTSHAVQQQSVDKIFLTIGIFYLLFK